MKPFRFSLQAVMTVRVNQERRALEAFALAQVDYDKVAARRRALESEINAVLSSRRDVLIKSASSEEIQVMQQGLRVLQESMRRCESDLQKAKSILDEKSKVLLDARQQREVIDKLREKQFAGYVAEAAKAEQKTADEFATLKSMGNLALKWK